MDHSSQLILSAATFKSGRLFPSWTRLACRGPDDLQISSSLACKLLLDFGLVLPRLMRCQLPPGLAYQAGSGGFWVPAVVIRAAPQPRLVQDIEPAVVPAAQGFDQIRCGRFQLFAMGCVEPLRGPIANMPRCPHRETQQRYCSALSRSANKRRTSASLALIHSGTGCPRDSYSLIKARRRSAICSASCRSQSSI